jgi:hypothetical protein
MTRITGVFSRWHNFNRQQYLCQAPKGFVIVYDGLVKTPHPPRQCWFVLNFFAPPSSSLAPHAPHQSLCWKKFFGQKNNPPFGGLSLFFTSWQLPLLLDYS